MSKTLEATMGQINDAQGKLPREAIVKAVLAFQATYPTKDWEARAALLSEDVIFEDTVGVPPPAIGRDAAREYFRMIIGYGWDIEQQPERLIVMGDEAFVLTRARWNMPGEEPIGLALFHNFKFNDKGEIRHVRIAYDKESLEL